ncbi:hypothetical protein E2C01_070374 [Portunus trituberculatus]|uniref:Uncharacterized protein n=1 Tax=Portunus trituberculatus TaxID=210409 RepID=A0A5B7I143_PORTR|nr:hypothetical protein [Portunus trituberculatus]
MCRPPQPHRRGHTTPFSLPNAPAVALLSSCRLPSSLLCVLHGLLLECLEYYASGYKDLRSVPIAPAMKVLIDADVCTEN